VVEDDWPVPDWYSDNADTARRLRQYELEKERRRGRRQLVINRFTNTPRSRRNFLHFADIVSACARAGYPTEAALYAELARSIIEGEFIENGRLKVLLLESRSNALDTSATATGAPIVLTIDEDRSAGRRDLIRAAGALAVQLWRPVPTWMLRYPVVDYYIAALLLGITGSPDKAAALARDLEREARGLTNFLGPTIEGLAASLSCQRCIGVREGRELLPFFLRLYGTAEIKSPLDLPPALAAPPEPRQRNARRERIITL
jgi:hypothetical protein